MNKEQEKELREKMLMKFVGITFHKKDIDWVIGGIKNLLKAQRENMIKGLEKRILKIVQECRHEVTLTNEMLFNCYIKDLEIKNAKICKFDEFEFADKISKIIKELKDE